MTQPGYDPRGEVDVIGHGASLATFLALALPIGALVVRSPRAEHFSLHDLLIGGLATHKFTRLLSKSAVTAPVRAPFTQFEAPTGSAEHLEHPRGHGWRHVVGELITCPFCLGQWVGASYVASLVLAPRAARTWAAVFSVTATSDALHLGYARLRGD